MKKKLIYAAITIVAVIVIGIGVMAYRKPALVITLGFIAETKLQQTSQEGSNDCTGLWSVPVTGRKPYSYPAYPETNAAYWLHAWNVNEFGGKQMMKISGDFPHARYISFHIYNGKTGKAIQALKDVDIQPDEGNRNPFSPSVMRDTPNRSYTVWIVPEGFAKEGQKNVLTFPDDLENIMLFYRIYRPDNGTSALGNSELPTMETFLADSGKPASGCKSTLIIPESLKKNIQKKADKIFYDDHVKRNEEKQVFPFYARYSDYSPFFPNLHIIYGISYLYKELGDLAVIRFKVPGFPRTGSGGGRLDLDTDVRYWSVCLGGTKETNTSGCVTDEEALISSDSWVTVVYGPDDDTLRKTAEEKGHNYETWGFHLASRKIYIRYIDNSKPFHGSYRNVPGTNDPSENFSADSRERFEAQNYIGDYAAKGIYCSEEEYLDDTAVKKLTW